jgi:DNA gyrase subunit B
MSKTYQASDIQILEGLDAVRMRPGMYIGSTGGRGLHHLIWEIVDNAIDEAANGYANQIEVTLKKDLSCEVADNGRGLPVDIHPQMGVSAVEVVYTQLHAGGKFNEKNYSYSGGLHGVGASVVNALSEWLVVDVYRDYSHYQQRFESIFDKKTGKVISGRPAAPLTKLSNTRKRGTAVCFKPDPRVFETVDFNADTVRRRLRELAYLNRGVRFIFTDERARDADARRAEYMYEGGLADFMKYLNADKNPVSELIAFEGQRESTRVRAAIQYTDSYTESLFSYVNNIPTPEGGTHEAGFKAVMPSRKSSPERLLSFSFNMPDRRA